MSLLGTLNPNINPERSVLAQSASDGDTSTVEVTQHASTASFGTDKMANEELSECEVTRLAQQLTRQSTCFSNSAELENPFVESKEDSTLNPHSANFKSRDWMKNLLALTSRDPERFPQRAAGISFRNLSVHGFGSPTDYQKDVFNSVLQIGHLFRLMTGTGKQKIQILRDFDGLVKSGEMLVVLGRPGR